MFQKRFGRALVITTIVALALPLMSLAAVHTDKADYAPGSVVTISGDNTNFLEGLGYQAGESVQVDVQGPNGYLSSCSGLVADDGTWSCQVTLWDSLDAVGSYTFSATGQTSGTTEAGSFTDAININSFAADCTTDDDSFPTGTTVCAKASGLPGSGGGSSGKIEWWAPGAATATRTTTFSGVSGNSTDTFAPAACGTWTLKVYSPSATFQDDDTFDVTGCVAPNQKPVADAGGPYTGAEGANISLSGSASDPDAGDTIASWTWSYSIVSADTGTTCAFIPAAANVQNPAFACDDDGSFLVSLVATDNHGLASSAASASVTLSNANPSATPNIPSANVPEGSSFTLSLSSPSDPGTHDTFAYQFDCGDGGGYNAASTSDSRLCPTVDNGSRSVKLKVLDDDGGSAEYTGTVTVENVNPTVVASFDGAADCQTSSSLTIDPGDPGVNDSPWKVNINWGDGSTEPEISRTNLDSFSVSHVYALAGVYNATVTVEDKDAGTGSDLINSITINQTYTVDFLPPFDDSTPSGLIVNKMKNGRVVPVKATIFDDCGLAPLTDPNANVTIKVSKTSGSGTGDPVEEYADAGESSAGTDAFRWSTDGFWIYNLDSKALGLVTNSFYRVNVYVGAVKASVDNWAILQPIK